jgi:flavin-dependent dehydrogenase
MYDVIIVGARCAGSPAAMLLARKGYRVLVVDRAHFPSDAFSTHFIQQPGVALLNRWGLVQPLVDAGTPLINKAAVGSLEAAPPIDLPDVPGVVGTMAPRRTVLDKILVDAARDAGAEVREGFTFEDVVRDGDRVTGIVGRNEAGESVTENAKLVIGADGRNSKVAEKVGAAMIKDIPPVTCGYFSYWADFEGDTAEVYFGDDRAHIIFPTNDERMVVIALWPPERFSEIRKDAETSYTNAVRTAPLLADRAKSAQQVERLQGGTVPNFLKQAWGPGWALIGDAGYHKDPTPADGISDAFFSVDLLVHAVVDVLSGNRAEDEAFNDFQTKRNEKSLPRLELCIKISSFVEPADQRAAGFAENAAMSYMHALDIAQETQSTAAAS